MGIYLNNFPQHTDYEEYKEEGRINKPHVAYCIKENEVHYDPVVDPYNGHEYVDLGLPSGTIWATKNVGADSPDTNGLCFAWGETVGYPTLAQARLNNKVYKWTDYAFNPSQSSSPSVSNMSKYNNTDRKTTLDLEDDAARVHMGGLWQMPTYEQINEFINSDVLTKEYVNNYEGTNHSVWKITSNVNGNVVIFRANELYMTDNNSFGNAGLHVWSKTLDSNKLMAIPLSTGVGQTTPSTWGNSPYNRYLGFQIRGVINREDL